MLGILTRDNQVKAIIPSKDRSAYSQVKYKFFLDAPFEISNRCCNISKKNPAHDYSKQTGRKSITAQMASESRLRTQKWLKNGCNAFENGNPVSNPMSFWTEQDVLLYCKTHELPLASVYGEIVYDFGEEEDQLDGQMTIMDFSKELDIEKTGIFDLERPLLKCTGCQRTGCVACGFGVHMEKGENRWELSERISNPKYIDYMLRGGAFDEDGLWKPDSRGLGYWFVIEWINAHGGKVHINLPHREKYLEEYSTPETDEYLKTDKSWLEKFI